MPIAQDTAIWMGSISNANNVKLFISNVISEDLPNITDHSTFPTNVAFGMEGVFAHHSRLPSL